MRFRAHGGQCCGISHAYDFFGFTARDERELRREVRWGRRHGHLYEIVLIDDELIPNDWDNKASRENKARLRNALLDLRFEFKTRFYNGNSLNYCNVYHTARNPKKGEDTPPDLSFDYDKEYEDE